ncbi:unnamed protein product [Aureobasidium uvarum]|uniref:Uncharacterized protein n=1 Tax=Aureobasidium uvarum TaxID=2773716 RepID=A0A9N8KBK1_9PEZI|nr:unnamed protein product [Aureobasidium uvarum]
MAQAREFPFHVVSAEPTSPDLLMAEAPTVVSDQVDFFGNMPPTSKQMSRPSTSLEPIVADDSFLPTLEVDDNIPDCAPIRIAHNSLHGKDRQPIPSPPRSSRHGKFLRSEYRDDFQIPLIVPYPITTIRDPILRAPGGVQRVYRKPRQRVRYTCHECSTPFRSHGRECDKCRHERCLDCRDKPSHKSQKSRPDPRLIEAVNKRLANVGK